MSQNPQELKAENEAPEKIWIHTFDGFRVTGPLAGPTSEYIRADVVAAQLAELEPLKTAAAKMSSNIQNLLNWLDEFEGDSRVPADVYNDAWNAMSAFQELALMAQGETE